MAMEKHFNKKGFTLAELLMAVLVISIIMVALAPVITKRVMDNVKVNIFKNNGKLFLYSTTNPTCTAAVDGQKSVDCIFTPPQGVNKVGVILVSGGGGGAGAASPALTYNMSETVASPTTATSQTKTLTITDTMKEVVITYMSGGGGGGSAGAYTETTDGIMSQADCDKYGAHFIPAQFNGEKMVNLCVTKYNAGDPGGPPIPEGQNIKIVSSNWEDNASIVKSSYTCYQGITAGSVCTGSVTGANGSVSTYSGCNRTVCRFDAAKLICANYAVADTKAGDWRIPSTDEGYWWVKAGPNSITHNLGAKGLQLCSEDSTMQYGSIYCPPLERSCRYAHNDKCYPHTIWTFNPNKNEKRGLYFAKTFGLEYYSYMDFAASVRCVYEKQKPSYKPYAGGGGGSAPYIKNYAIPENIINDNIGGKIEIIAGAGGKGSNPTSAAGISSDAAERGFASVVKIYNPEGNLVWGLSVAGGDNAKKTIISDTGYGSSEPAQETPINNGACQIYDGTNWKKLNCTGAGTGGQRGETAEEAGVEPSGGNGGNSLYAGNNINGGLGGTGTNTQGGNGTSWGAGGGGGAVYTTYDSSTGAPIANKGKGGNGGNGIVEINYGESLQVAGGGAGGGGAFARIINLEVVPGQEYQVRVGGGGTGGNANNPGQNGGQSWIKIGATTYSLDGGEGGKVGTAQTPTTTVTHGLGGQGSFVPSGVANASEDYYDGDDGTAGDSVTDDLTGRVIGSSGGCGGISGIGSTGSTGGMNICTEGGVINGIHATPLTFLSPGNIFNQAVYGTAGAGGGGGGWDRREGHYIDLGNGSSGLDGYVYVFWTDHG